MTAYRLFLYSDGLVLPVIIPLNCSRAEINDRLRRVFREDVASRRAEIWLGAVKIMDINPEAIGVLMRMAEADAGAAVPVVLH
jgi:hypothetical protein